MICFRNQLREEDLEIIADMVSSTSLFDERDVDMNVGVARHALHCQECKHKFIFAELEGKMVAYACFTELPDADAGTYELYWLLVAENYRGRGIGGRLVTNVIEYLRCLGAKRLYVKTDSVPQYALTRHFYEKCGFTLTATLPDYYRKEDDCCIYCLEIAPQKDDD